MKLFRSTGFFVIATLATSLMGGVLLQAQSTRYDLIDTGEVAGLYRTGVNDSGQKLGQDQDDPHWIIDRVYRPPAWKNPTCQSAHRGGTSLVAIPLTSSPTPIPARTILERGGQAGLITTRDKAVTGNATGIDDGVSESNGILPWKFNVPNARWIGQNLYGQNTTVRGCRDPTDTPGRIMANANIYVFKLKDGFTFSDGVDINSVSLKLGAAVDNRIEVKINGTTVPARLVYGTSSNSTQYRNVNEPGFTRGSPSIETRPTEGIFRPNGQRNELELHIQSTYSHTGLLIKEIEALASRPTPTANFNITPSVSLSKTIVQPGEQVSAMPSLNNTGTSNSTAVSWQLTRFILPRGSSIPAGVVQSSQDPTIRFGNRSALTAQGSIAVPRGTLPLADSQGAIEDLPAGTRICYATSVRPYSDSSPANEWRHGQAVCAVIGTKPLVQIHGGDLRVGGQFKGAAAISDLTSRVNTSSVTRDGKTFGSWVEYGIQAPGAVIGTASGSGLSNGSVEASQQAWSKLTFANTPEFGKFSSSQRTLPDTAEGLLSLYNISAAPQVTGNVQLTPTISGLRMANGDITVPAYNFTSPGQSVVIYAPDSTVTITGNVTYGSMTLRSIQDIPQLVIIANQIKINSSVTQLDSWLIANGESGRIDTCSDVAQLSTTVCNRQLTINGPVAAKQLLLKRTASSNESTDAGRSTPAEILNLRPDAYLWAKHAYNNTKRAITTSTVELPPRF
ncbi:hypothetical protein HY312_04155 [Candidatus Saccharibacteria bacterium]|nr:hypothetical protein [Candidatus Saccharibacteria bacterium]